jgi:hypothetical protein
MQQLMPPKLEHAGASGSVSARKTCTHSKESMRKISWNYTGKKGNQLDAQKKILTLGRCS